jgi:hypothetical protein
MSLPTTSRQIIFSLFLKIVEGTGRFDRMEAIE